MLVSTPEAALPQSASGPADPRRRRLLQQSVAAAGVAWAVPVVSTLREPAAAAVGSGGCPYVYCFDSGTTEGWTINNSAGAGNGLWKVSNARSVSPSFSLHYGNGVGGTYDTGGRNSGTVTSPVIGIPAAGGSLSFDLWRRVELFTSGTWDEFSVSVLPAGATIYAVSRDGGTGGIFVPIVLSLAAYAGQNVQIVFTFDTKDGAANNFEGIYVDNVTVPCITPPAGSLGTGGSLRSLDAGGASDWFPDAEPTAQDLGRRR